MGKKSSVTLSSSLFKGRHILMFVIQNGSFKSNAYKFRKKVYFGITDIQKSSIKSSNTTFPFSFFVRSNK